MTQPVAEASSRADVRAVFAGRPSGVVIAAEPAYGILTCALPGASGREGNRVEPLLVKVATTAAAARAVQDEARLLVELRRRRLGPVEKTIPRHVGMRAFNGYPVALSSTVPGRPMAAEYRGWLRTTQPWLVRRDFRYAGDWLAAFQEASVTDPAPTGWVHSVTDAVHERWRGHPLLAPALARLGLAAHRLEGLPVVGTAVHGDFWHGNLLVDTDREAVSGVVNWTAGEEAGSPLRDLARFPLRYGQYPDEHRRVAGAPRSRGARVRSALLGTGWYPRTVRSYLIDGLTRLGVPSDRWFDLALAGVAEIAAEDADELTAEAYLAALASLPDRRA